MSTEQRLSELSEHDFDAVIDSYIEQTVEGENELPAGMFIDLLVERSEQHSGSPVTLSIAVHGDQLEIIPDREGIDVVINGNEVFVAGRRLVLRLAEHSD